MSEGAAAAAAAAAINKETFAAQKESFAPLKTIFCSAARNVQSAAAQSFQQLFFGLFQIQRCDYVVF